MKKSVLRQYARLIAVKGANVQKGQEVLLYAELDQPEFVTMLVDECYKAGAKKVWVEWMHEPMEILHARYQKQAVLSEVTEWERAKLQHMVDTLPARIFLESADPDGLAGIKQPKYSKAVQARARVRKPYRDAIDNKHQWCIAAVPGVAWAKKMYPKLSKKQAVEQLWKDILYTARADSDDPIGAWNAHNADLQARCDYLNGLQLRSLHYRSANGTDLTVGLIPEGKFAAGSDKTLKGVEYNPNMPTEEVFVSPMRGEAEGIVYSTKPLSYQGQLIDNFSLRFEKGRVVEVKAEKNEALLQSLVDMDEGAHYLGEVALVPKESPISASGLLFYNTLFDENASCHLAIGDGFSSCLEGSENMTLEECHAKGINESIVHTDFMIGSDDLDIEGTTVDGKTVAIFKNGTWAF